MLLDFPLYSLSLWNFSASSPPWPLHLTCAVPAGEQQGQAERDEVVAVAGGSEGLPAQGLRKGAEALHR